MILRPTIWSRLRNRLFHPRAVTHTEWLKLMRGLEQGKPPTARSRFAAKGAEGVSFPERKGKAKKVVEMRRSVQREDGHWQVLIDSQKHQSRRKER